MVPSQIPVAIKPWQQLLGAVVRVHQDWDSIGRCHGSRKMSTCNSSQNRGLADASRCFQCHLFCSLKKKRACSLPFSLGSAFPATSKRPTNRGVSQLEKALAMAEGRRRSRLQRTGSSPAGSALCRLQARN